MDGDWCNSQLLCSLSLTFVFLFKICFLTHKLQMSPPALRELASLWQNYLPWASGTSSYASAFLWTMRFRRRLTGSWRDEELGRTREVGALLLGRECAGKVPLAPPRRGGWQDPTERPAAAPACSPGTGLGSSHDAPLSASPVHPHVVLLRSLKLLPSRCLHFPYPTLTFHLGPFRPPRAQSSIAPDPPAPHPGALGPSLWNAGQGFVIDALLSLHFHQQISQSAAFWILTNRWGV